MKTGLRAFLLTAVMTTGAVFSTAVLAQQSQPQSPIPNAPIPQKAPPLSKVDGPITPGEGSSAPTPSSASAPAPAPAPAPQKPAPAPKAQTPSTTPAKSSSGSLVTGQSEGQAPASGDAALGRLVMNVNYVQVPTLVKDSKGNQVAGLTWRNFEIYENGVKQNLAFFSTDPQPLSIAYVIDQSLPSNVMQKVNESLGAIQGSLAPYDSAAVFTYSNGSKEWTGFTGAQSQRLPAVLSLAKAVGSDAMVPVNSGPMAGCPIRQNGMCVDPNIQPGRSAGSGSFITIPKEIHTLNDAILAAARQLSVLPKGRRRIIYVISDGKEYGSKATTREVIRYLQTNNIAVYGTLVGESAEWGIGFISRLHLPFTMYDNVLYKYTASTGGDLDTQLSVNGIENSYAKIAAEARNQYTLGYYSHESIYDGRYRKIDVRVNRPNLEVIAKPGYYPSAQEYK